MTLLLSWVVFPLVLALLAVGCGLLVEAAVGRHLPGALLPGIGLALLIVVAQFIVLLGAFVEFVAPLAAGLAVAGFLIGRPWQRPQSVDWAAVAVAGAVYAVFAAPFVLSGEATFGGYVKLDDTASWLGIADWVTEHGLSYEGLPPSSYEAMLDFYLGSDYPVAVFLPLGIGSLLTGADVAWLYQPYLAFFGVLLGLTLYELMRRWIATRPPRAIAALVAAQPALLYGFVLWGGVKEIAAAWLVALLAAVAALTLEGDWRRLLPAALTVAALLATLSVGGALWALPLLGLLLVVAIRRAGIAWAAARAGSLAVIVVALCVPALLGLGFIGSPAYLGASSPELVTDATRLANLIEPLSPLQGLGIWIVEDFRLPPAQPLATYLLLAVLAAAALLGAFELWRRRAEELTLPLYVAGAAIGGTIVVLFGSPWVDAKGLATASPAVIVSAFVGIAALARRFDRPPAAAVAWVAGTAIVAGVAWSNSMAYQGVSLAPHDRFSELEEIGERFAGDGPALMTEYEPYGVRHFLRDLDPEGASDLRRRIVPRLDGTGLDKGEFADIDQFQLAALLEYRTLVLRRSPAASRPPSQFELAWRGELYDVWRLDANAPQVLERLPLGNVVDPAAVPSCAALRALAERHPGATIVASERAEPIVIDPSRVAERPDGWEPVAGAAAVLPNGGGMLVAPFELAAAGATEVWVGGGIRGRVDVWVDGRHVGGRRHRLGHGGQYVPVGDIRLDAGHHRLRLRYSDTDIHPGSGGGPLGLGPIVLAERDPSPALARVGAADVTSLCGRRLDWAEAVAR